jgi:CubicO group peptidase (beta-lactamase class C family)
MRSLLLLVLLLASVHPVCAQSRESAFAGAADTLLQEAIRDLGAVPGLAMAVVHGDQTVYARGAGLANVEESLPFTADTPFYVASVTKPFTALLAALLDRDGALRLDASLADLFPDVAFSPAIEADSVTVRHLLSHTAGIDNGPIGFRAAYSGEHTPSLMRLLLAGTAPAADAPRGSFAYTNVGYNILSLRLDELDGGPWQSLLAARLFAPLGMTRTTAYASEASRWRPAVPYALAPDGSTERIALVKHDDTMQAAGGMISTATDLARWLTLHLNAGRLDGRQLVPADVIAAAHRPVAIDRGDSYGRFVRDGYALGWQTGTYDGDTMLHHFGGFPGFHAHTSFMPARDVGVVVLVNESTVGGQLASLLAAFAYDWWNADPSETDAVGARARQALDGLKAEMDARLLRSAQGLAQRAGRTWQLSRPFSAYTGTYHNAGYGTMVVESPDGALTVRLGRLHAVATPFTQPETARVELIPGSGQVIQFRIDGERVDALVWNGETFERRLPD